MARQNSALRFETTVAKARHSLVSAANESGHSSGVLAGKIRRLDMPSCQLTVFHETADSDFSMGWEIRIS